MIGFEDDEGRGWCVFESSISGEIILRLLPVPWMRAALEILPPKMLALASDVRAEEVRFDATELGGAALGGRVERVSDRIQRATFTGAGIAEDMTKGIMDRFRSLPMSRSAVLVGRESKVPSPFV